MRDIQYFFWFWLPPLSYMAAIFYVSSLQNPQMGGETPDYVLHALEYFLLTLLLIRLLLSRSAPHSESLFFSVWQRACLVGFALAVFYGLSDELHQYFVPGRHCTWSDALADTFGAFCAYSAGLFDYRLFNKHPARKAFAQRYPTLSRLSYAFYKEQ